MRRARGWLANLLVMILATTACAVGLEVVARARETLRVRGEERQMRTQLPFSRFHPRLGWEKTPLSMRRIRRREFDIVIEVNAKGLRGPDLPHEKPPGARRVLLLGDSFTAGYYVNEADSLRAVLERRLNAAGCSPCQVINGGTIAYSTDQEYLFYMIEGRRYQPDVVVLLFYYNDVFYNAAAAGPSGEIKPLFGIENGALTLQAETLQEPLDAKGKQSYEVAHRSPLHGSMALRWLANRTVDARPVFYRFMARRGVFPPISTEPPPELQVFGPHRRNENDWSLTEAILARLKADVARDHGRLVVFYIPARFEVNDEVWRLTRERYALGPRWQRTRVLYRLRLICAALDLPLVDPLEPFAREERRGRPGYYTRDVHWNAIGNRIAADALAPAVEAALKDPDRGSDDECRDGFRDGRQLRLSSPNR